MSTAKIVGGFIFLTIGIVLLVIAFVPIPGLMNVSVIGRFIFFFRSIDLLLSTLDFSTVASTLGSISLAWIIPLIGYHYCRAGIRSMRYDRKKKIYIFTETKIGLMIAGFILVCIAVVIILMILLGLLEPAFQFLVDLVPTFFYTGLLPQLLIPIALTMLIMFFIYWIGSKIMRSGVKKEKIS